MRTPANSQRWDTYCWQPAVCTCIFRDDLGGTGFEPTKHIPLLARKGFKLIEVTCYMPDRDFQWQDGDKVRELMMVCADNDIGIWSAHPPENEALLGADDRGRRENLEMLKAFADLSNQLGCDCIPIHLWSTTRTLEQIKKASLWDSVPAELERICREQNVTLCVETLRSTVSLVSNAALLDMLAARKSCLGMVVDSGHSQISDDLHEITPRSGSFLKSLHLHDNDGVHDKHQIPGTGTIDWTRFAQDLRTAQYTGPIMYEVCFLRAEDLDTALDNILGHHERFFDSMTAEADTAWMAGS